MNALQIPTESSWIQGCRTIRRQEDRDFYDAGMSVFGDRSDAEQLVRSLVLLRLFPTNTPVWPFGVLIAQNIEACAGRDDCAPLGDEAPFFNVRIEIPVRYWLRDPAVTYRELFTEIFTLARPVVEPFWEKCKNAAEAIGRMFAPAAISAAGPADDPLWKHLRCELLVKDSDALFGIPQRSVTESILLVGGWPKRTMLSPMTVKNWLMQPGLPRLTRDGDRVTIEITHAQACYRIVREIDDLLELELVGSS